MKFDTLVMVECSPALIQCVFGPTKLSINIDIVSVEILTQRRRSVGQYRLRAFVTPRLKYRLQLRGI